MDVSISGMPTHQLIIFEEDGYIGFSLELTHGDFHLKTKITKVQNPFQKPAPIEYFDHALHLAFLYSYYKLYLEKHTEDSMELTFDELLGRIDDLRCYLLHVTIVYNIVRSCLDKKWNEVYPEITITEWTNSYYVEGSRINPRP